MYQPLKFAAMRAGIGFHGKHTILITKPYGSWVALKAVITNANIEADQPYGKPECGKCVACIKACPTGAIYKPFKLNARRCINPITRCPRCIPHNIRVKMGAWLYGCEICQRVCPKNKFLKPRKRSEHAKLPFDLYDFKVPSEYGTSPNSGLEENFPRLIPLLKESNSPLIRRNAAIVLGNLGDLRALPALEEQLKKESDFVRSYVQYAIQKIKCNSSF